MAERDESGLPPNVHGTSLTVGTFDGVHRGHVDILHRVSTSAQASGLSSLVVTFRPHPLEVVNKSAAPLLLSVGDEQLAAFASTPIEYASVLPFTSALARYSAEQFVRDVLVARYRMRELWIGFDHGMGRGRQGDVNELRRLGDEHGFPVHVVEAVTDEDGSPISSTSIRQAITDGDLPAAARALGRRYGFQGRVVPGENRGRALGFPTLNLELPSDRKLLPATGVYAVLAQTPRGAFGGMMNLGARPTFEDYRLSLEVHLFDVRDDFYGMDVEVAFVRRLRDVQAFPNAAALVEQLRRDEESARLALTDVQKPLSLKGST